MRFNYRKYIDGVIAQYQTDSPVSRIDEIARYAMNGGGKRLRPTLTLMLVESLGLKFKPFDPLIVAIEQFHAASLLFDDLPAQDNARLRRGKPTAHVAFDEAGAQLAGISLLSTGFGVLAELGKHYPAERVNEVIQYFGTVLGPEKLCLGQDMDLRFSPEDITVANIEKMYSLKTSILLEASLVPVLMLENYPKTAIELVGEYAYHTGIVYQLQDDILDATGTSSRLGKDTEQDTAKVNMVRSFGISTARRRMKSHIAAARAGCKKMSFDTTLLESTLDYFATHNR
jgi:geranylgeranyl pyrophosphate synthase